MHRLPNTRTLPFLKKPFPSPDSASQSAPKQAPGAVSLGRELGTSGDLSQGSEEQSRDVGERPAWQISFPKDIPVPPASSLKGSQSRITFLSAPQAQPNSKLAGGKCVSLCAEIPHLLVLLEHQGHSQAAGRLLAGHRGDDTG